MQHLREVGVFTFHSVFTIKDTRVYMYNNHDLSKALALESRGSTIHGTSTRSQCVWSLNEESMAREVLQDDGIGSVRLIAPGSMLKDKASF